MDLSSLTNGLDVRSLGERGAVRICDITDDSRTVVPGSLFVARAGAEHDGRRYIQDAIAAGAVAILTDQAPESAGRAAIVLADDVATVSARMAERFFGEPSHRLALIGVTGTNGKTTTAHLVHEMLNASGIRCGLIGTIEIDDGVETAPATLTTPAAIETSRTLGLMVESGCRACVMEVSSHALTQGRVAGLHFDVGVFTNLTGDHLDYHATMEDYARAKSMLFSMLDERATAIYNGADEWAQQVLGACPAARIDCRLDDAHAQARALMTGESIEGTLVTLEGPWGRFEARTSLIGRHNAMNLLQALCAATSAGLDAHALGPSRLAALVARLHAPPGRLEPVDADDLSIFVDYAHTDDALKNVLTSLRPLVPQGADLWVVFGCGGDRDRTKRARMGEVASNLADRLVITSDNPRTEPARAIISEIIEGVEPAARSAMIVEQDREAAITRAICEARPRDVILIAGKGHEDYQILADGRGGTFTRPFDDRLVAADGVKQRREQDDA